MKIKQLLLAVLLAGNAAVAQSIAINTTDAATGNRLVMTKNHKGQTLQFDDSVAKSGLAFFSVGYQSIPTAKGPTVETYFIDLDMFHNNNKLGCINQATNDVELTLEDGTKIECFQISDSDCGQESFKGAFALVGKDGSAEQMEQNFKKLLTTGITRIIVNPTEGELDYKISSKSSDFMKKHFALVEKTVHNQIK
jgi:hypothetical protein